jgi:arsenate reductase
MTSLKIYHNPRCSKSRQTLSLIQENGVDVEIIEYLKTPPSAAELTSVLKLLKLEPSAIIRKNESEYKESGLNDPQLSKQQQIDLMVAFPKVIERPIVVAKNAAVIGRPPENVLTLV